MFVRLESHGEFVEVFSYLVVVVEAFDEVDFFVSVEVMKFCDLVSACDVDFVFDDFESEWLEESCGDTFPFKF